MKLIIVFIRFFLVCFLFTSCSSIVSSVREDTINAIKVSRKFPIMDNMTGKFLRYELEEASLFYWEDFILHKVSYQHNFIKIATDGVAEVDGKELRTKYFVHRKGSVTGYYTDSSNSIYLAKYPVDSILSNYWYLQSFIDPVFDQFKTRLIDTLSGRGSVYQDVYFFQNKSDTGQTGTITLEFSDAFPSVAFTLSKKMDTVKGKKLINLKVVNKARFSKLYGLAVDEVEQNRELEILKKFNFSEVRPFFEFVKGRQ